MTKTVRYVQGMATLAVTFTCAEFTDLITARALVFRFRPLFLLLSLLFGRCLV